MEVSKHVLYEEFYTGQFQKSNWHKKEKTFYYFLPDSIGLENLIDSQGSHVIWHWIVR